MTIPKGCQEVTNYLRRRVERYERALRQIEAAAGLRRADADWRKIAEKAREALGMEN